MKRAEVVPLTSTTIGLRLGTAEFVCDLTRFTADEREEFLAVYEARAWRVAWPGVFQEKFVWVEDEWVEDETPSTKNQTPEKSQTPNFNEEAEPVPIRVKSLRVDEPKAPGWAWPESAKRL